MRRKIKDTLLKLYVVCLFVVWVAGVAIFIGATFALGAWIALLITGF